ncbi:MAG TPA: R3H domain-containing nucleic acid-binding protein [Candidatus Pacearchaeota archaeon]|nr:R3H domain-containing nucleic acid-binding protein [Candidatus Pacearchaeota archaeon]HPR79783.1 R3H domain-containing nucleic acid-binding protein [Candidatus Pacearchaeota archaeon]
MIDQEEVENIKEIIKEFFLRAGFIVEVEGNCINREGEDVLEIDIKTGEAQNLIGKQGLVLADIQLLLRKVIKKKTDKEFYLSLDIDGYKKNKESYLRNIAQSVADEVSRTKREKELPYTSSFDRRVVHMELADRKDITTESIGEGEERRIIIKPVL